MALRPAGRGSRVNKFNAFITRSQSAESERSPVRMVFPLQGHVLFPPFLPVAGKPQDGEKKLSENGKMVPPIDIGSILEALAFRFQ